MSKPFNKLNKPLHGGDLTAATKTFGIPEDQWIDLSTGINSESYPNIHLDKKVIRTLPTIDDMTILLNGARKFYRANKDCEIIAGPGTQSILQILPLLFPSQKVAILSPTYSEHQYTWEQAGNKVMCINTLNSIPRDVIAVVVNPNNPDGKKYQVEDILKLSEKLILLIVDEAFCDNSPDLSTIPHLAGHNILVLRSLGKFFGLAGLRLGFAIGMSSITQSLSARLGPWAVSGPAIEIGTRALLDSSWISKMRKTLKAQSSRLNRILAENKLSVIGNTDLFTLISTERAFELYSALAKEGILVRRFEEHPNWIRIGLPGTEIEWQKLKCVLNATLKHYQ